MGRQTVGARGYVNARNAAEDRRAWAETAGQHRGFDARALRERAERDRRYRDGDCTVCGYALDDASLAGGFERCGDCEQV